MQISFRMIKIILYMNNEHKKYSFNICLIQFPNMGIYHDIQARWIKFCKIHEQICFFNLFSIALQHGIGAF